MVKRAGGHISENIHRYCVLVKSVPAKYLHARWNRVKERVLPVPAVQLVIRTIKELGEDDATHMAAGVAYYVILSIFPLILGLIAILGVFLTSETVKEELFSFLQQTIPAAVDLIEQNIEAVINLRGTLGIISIITLLWSASGMFGAIDRSVNRAWDIPKDRPFPIRKLRDIGMAVSTGLLLLLSMGATSLFAILRGLDIPGLGAVVDVAARLFAFIMSFIIFLLIYKYIPNTRTYWRYVWTGALLAAVLFEIAKSLFVYYLNNFANYESVYGNVGSFIILLLWIYISALILILGAKFSSEYGRMRRRIGRGMLLEHGATGADAAQPVDEKGEGS
jgi:membrane protein